MSYLVGKANKLITVFFLSFLGISHGEGILRARISFCTGLGKTDKGKATGLLKYCPYIGEVVSSAWMGKLSLALKHLKNTVIVFDFGHWIHIQCCYTIALLLQDHNDNTTKCC